MFARTPQFLVGIGLLTGAACRSAMDVVTAGDAAVVQSVVPSNGAEKVDPGQPIVVRFSRSMMSGSELLVVLHEQTVTGPVVPGSYTWSADRSTLTFAPTSRLAARTAYVVHLAPDLRSGTGARLNHGACTALGGRAVTGSMMGTANMSSGGMGTGMMGSGWTPVGTSRGMMFTFTTS